jgi:N-carbamoyl-L-amino-acid hydrolase
VFVRSLANELGGSQRGTVGRIEVSPNLVNVVAERAVMTVDLRNMDESVLRLSEDKLRAFMAELERREKVRITMRDLTRFAATPFAPEIIALVESTASALGHSSRRLPSGAGHDAQMMARVCPAGMIFVPSIGGLSHNVKEDTRPEHLAAGADVLLNIVAKLAT